MDPGEIQLVEQTRQVNTAFGQYQWAQARPASIQGCVPVYPPKSLYPQLDKNLSQIAREPQNLDGMERPFLDSNETCKPGLSQLRNYIYPTTKPYPSVVKPKIELPYNALDDPHQGWKRYLAETEGPQKPVLVHTASPTPPVTPSPSPNTCGSLTFKSFPKCLVSSLKDTFHDLTHWNQVPTPKLAHTFTSDHRLIYLIITITVAVLVILLFAQLFKSKPKTPYVTQQEFDQLLLRTRQL